MVRTKPVAAALPEVAELRGTLSVEKRLEARYPTNDAAQLQIMPSNGTWLPCTVIDISKSGLRLELGTQLTRNVRIEVMITPLKLVIFGEVRYCRRSGEHYHAGILIEGVVFPKPDNGQHIHDDQLILYVAGKGLTTPEILRAKNHLMTCDECVSRMAETKKELRASHGLSWL